MRVEGNTTILLFGKSYFKSNRKAELFGAVIDEIEVPEGKVYPIYIKDDSDVEIKGNYFLVNGKTIPKSWENFVKKDYRRIFVMGDVDKGKSSFCVYAMNKLNIGEAIDADIGQNDIAHPAAMGLGLKRSEIYSLSQLKLKDAAFVGVISPSGFEARCLKAFKYLTKIAGEDVIVDTTGWIRGKKARDYKLAKIEIFEPEVVVSFDFYPYFIENCDVYQVESFVVKKRDRNARFYFRGRKYEEWLRDAEIFEVNAKDVKLQNTTMFKGEEIRDEILESFGDVIYAEKGFDFLNIYSERFEVGTEVLKFLREYFNVAEINIVKPSDLENLFVGLRDEKYISPGLLKEIDFENKKLRLLGKKSARVISFSNFKLSEDLKEMVVRVP